MALKDKRVLVTGAGGFIGSHLTEALVRMGAETTALVRYNSRNDHGMIELLPEEEKKDLTVIQGDLRDSDAIKAAVRDVDVIFHLGALIAIPYSYLHPRETIETNIMGTLNVLTAAREIGVEKVVHTSTSEVYGTARYVPIDEEHPLQGQSPYSASKIGADKIVESFHDSYEIPVATIRPFNTYGPRQSARAIIPTIISQALGNRIVKLGSLTPTRDFTYVLDTVQGFLKVAESPKSTGEVINIGSNFEISIGDLAHRIIEKIDDRITIQCEELRKRPAMSEVQRLWVNNEKAKRLLDWSPTYTLDRGLEETIRWVSDHLQIFNTKGYVI